MADKRGSAFPAASAWSPTATFLQDDPAGITEKVTPAQVETKLEADGFIKAASPSLGQVAAYTAGGWAPIKLADANIDAAAAIGWGKISKTGAVAADVGALPASGGTTNRLAKWTGATTQGLSSISDSGIVVSVNAALGAVGAVSASGGIARISASAINPATEAWFGFGALNQESAPIGFYANDSGGVGMYSAGSAPIVISNGVVANSVTINGDGSIAIAQLAGTGTRAVAADSTGKLVAGSANIRTFGTASASFTYSASTPSVVRTTGAIFVTLPAAADFSGSETVFFQEYVGGNSLGFTGQTFESSVSSGSWVTHASGYGWSVAWRKIILSCDGITWYVVVQ